MKHTEEGDKVASIQQKPTPLREVDFTHYLKHYLSLLWRWKLWIVIAGPLASAATLIYLLKFHSSNPELPATVLIGLENPPTVTIGIDFVDVDNSKAELMKTRTFLKDIVNKLSLRFQVKKFPRNDIFDKILVDSLARSGKYVFSINRENTNVYTVAYTGRRFGYKNKVIQSGKLATLNTIDLTGIHLKFTRSFLKDPHKVTFYVTGMPKAIDNLHNSVAIKKPDVRRQLFHIEVSLKGRDYILIAKILNTIADAFVEKKLMFMKRKTQSVLSVLEKQFSKARSGLAGAEGRLKNFRTANPTVGLTQSTQRTVNTLIGLETNDFAIKSSLKEARRLQSKFLDVFQDNNVQIAEEILIFLNEQNITAAPVLQMEFNRLLAEKRALQFNNYASTHPLIIENKASVEKLLQKVDNTLASFMKSSKEKTQQKASEIQMMSDKLRRLPSKEVRMAELQRRHQVNAGIYSTVSDRYNQAKVAETIEVADVYVMDYAAPPIPPPVNILKFLGICLLLGIAIAFGPAIFSDMISKTVRTEFELQKMTDIVVLESIPTISTPKRGKE